eukprot:TRINITY_DN7520_c0_g1_i1.p2 TRINITY_DN7520_c0_g1~~TRINITY_DN7520_c0_g1_i1.p2  ORF type:complete len:117 (-),score=46.86 TRINITY_DN7520_c0_g1_i1:40-390(-)
MSKRDGGERRAEKMASGEVAKKSFSISSLASPRGKSMKEKSLERTGSDEAKESPRSLKRRFSIKRLTSKDAVRRRKSETSSGGSSLDLTDGEEETEGPGLEAGVGAEAEAEGSEEE